MGIENVELTDNSGNILDATAFSYDCEHLRFSVDEKILKSRDGIAQVFTTPNKVGITNGSNGLSINDRGTVINGKTHITNYPSDTRFASFWTFNDELLTGLPSTVYTPLPVLVYSDPPFAKHLSGLAKMIKAILG
jgi:hypothetical protein